MFENKVFTVTQPHIDLINRMYIDYNHWTEFGAPEVDPKRPYGNSDVYSDIAEILGIQPTEKEWGEIEFTEDEIEYMNKVHKETATVLQILVENATEGISPGVYEGSWAGRNWKRV